MKKNLFLVFCALLLICALVSCDGNATSDLFSSREYGDCLCFTPTNANFSMSIVSEGHPSSINLLYSKNGKQWLTYTVGEVVKIPAKGKLYLRANGSNSTFSKSASDYYRFVFTGSFETSGNIMYLLDSEGKQTSVPAFAFVNLFKDCKNLLSSPSLPAEELGQSCYQGLFSGCTNLNEIKVGFKDWGSKDQTLNWVQGVASTGVFECPAVLSKTISLNGVPSNWARKTDLPMFWLSGDRKEGTYCVLHQDANLFISYSIDKVKVEDTNSSLYGESVYVLTEIDRTVPDGKSVIQVENELYFNGLTSQYNGSSVNSDTVEFFDAAKDFFNFIKKGSGRYVSNCSCTFNGEVYYIVQ